MDLLGKVVQTTELISSKADRSGKSSFILCTKKKGLNAKTNTEELSKGKNCAVEEVTVKV